MSEINYSISFEKPYTHYCEVEIHLKDLNQDKLIFTMPVWAPGSYLVRDFSKNLEDVYAENPASEKLSVEKINKNSWEVSTSGQKEIFLKYKVYCNELTVRTSLINSDQAFISCSGVFMYARGFENLKCKLSINLPSEWKKISTGLDKISDNIFIAENYDIFIDSPVELGNQEILEFEIEGIKHYISLTGKGNYNKESLVNDFKKIAEEEIELMGGDIPYKHYTFIIHLVEKGGGGLEHHNSFVCQMNRLNFNDEKLYKKFLGLVSHEFFHLWNVKRIRPVELGPFDYEKENYTKSLWVSEGWTSFYDDLVLLRSGILDNKEYFEFLCINVNDIMRFSGRFSQSLADSSFDTWIKFYKKDENFNNSQISYYTKGALTAMMLDIEIIKSTNAEKSLDDALRILYKDYKKDPTKGFSEERVRKVCETVSGKKLDDFWKKYIYGTDEMPIAEYLAVCGLNLINENENEPPGLDIEIKQENGKLLVTKVFKGGSAFEAGVNARDELIAVDYVRADADVLKRILKDRRIGDEVKVMISRDGIIKETGIKLLGLLPKYKIEEKKEMSEDEKRNLGKWLRG